MPTTDLPATGRPQTRERAGTLRHDDQDATWYVERELGARLLAVWDEQLSSLDPIAFPGYAEGLSALNGRSAVRSGLVDFMGAGVAVVEFDFGVLGGSMGASEGEKIVRAFDRARSLRVPLLAVVRTGGARMQEGMVALVQMARTTDALLRHQSAGLMSLALLRSPTTGGVFVSWASLMDLRAVESDAVIGFGGPRVVEQATGSPPHGSHSSSSAGRHGIVDAVVDPGGAHGWVGAALGLIDRPLELLGQRPVVSTAASDAPGGDPSAMEMVESARSPRRPSGLEWAAALTRSWTPIAGAGDIVHAGLATLGSTRLVVVAMDRHADGMGGTPRLGTADYRLARRAVASAGRWGLPVLTLVDTIGADPSSSAENGGIAHEIATLFREMARAPVATLSLCVGEGGSGGALAFSHADAFWMLEDAVYSVIGPEGAATILWRDATRAPEAAEHLALTAPRLLELGVIDQVVATADSVEVVARRIENALQRVRIGNRTSRPDQVTAMAVGVRPGSDAGRLDLTG
jgi:acetyl-CoA carboxylase alpha subunit/acetyl-CoA carboxylase beta subunit